jgi:hypothetical protein
MAPAIGALQNKGVQVEIHLYSGRLAKAIKNYSVDRDIHWILTQFPRPGLFDYLSIKTLVPLGWSNHWLSVRADPSFSEEQRQQGHTIERTGTLG